MLTLILDPRVNHWEWECVSAINWAVSKKFQVDAYFDYPRSTGQTCLIVQRMAYAQKRRLGGGHDHGDRRQRRECYRLREGTDKAYVTWTMDIHRTRFACPRDRRTRLKKGSNR